MRKDEDTPKTARKTILRRITIALLLAVPLLTVPVGCGGGAGAMSPPEKEPDPRGKEYEIGPLDQIKVVVWKNAELSAEVTVRPDGIATFPLVGDMKVSGRTPSQIHRDLGKRYGEFVTVTDSTISVSVSQFNSYSFTVSGNVEKAGVYKERNFVTVLEAVALAGGPNKYAGTEAYVVRGTPPRKVPIDLKRAASAENPKENIVVLRGDIIVVP